MALVTLQDIHLSHGGPNLLDGISFSIEPGDRVCIVGRNGVGKSTLLRVIAGQETPDSGVIGIDDGTTVALLPQESPPFSDLSARDAAITLCSQSVTDNARVVEEFLHRLRVDGNASIDALSGGEIRRTILAGTLASGSDLLLLDEPTNHLDIDTIIWLESHLTAPAQKGIGVVFVTHDRAFAQRIASRVIEIDRGAVYLFTEEYDTYLRRRREQIAAEEQQNAVFEKKLAVEEAWLRRGTRARRTRDEGRVKALKRMREEYQSRRMAIGLAGIGIAESGRSGDLVVETEDLTIRWTTEEEPTIRSFTTTIYRGDRIGVIGPNGSGKTTLIRTLIGEDAAGEVHEDKPLHSGTIRRGANLDPIYFDQLRVRIDPETTLFDAFGDGYETITVDGARTPVVAYMKRFLFSESDIRRPIGTLSGGERNRLLLARLFARRSNVLVLDEPTNDLDIETLELLESRLEEYSGTLIVVSHDRRLIDNLVAACFVIQPDGTVVESVGGYTDWIERNKQSESTALPKAPKEKGKTRARPTQRARKLSFNEKREILELPDRIAVLEDEQREIETKLSDPELYRTDGAAVATLSQRLKSVGEEIESAYARWATLEAIEEEA